MTRDERNHVELLITGSYFQIQLPDGPPSLEVACCVHEYHQCLPLLLPGMFHTLLGGLVLFAFALLESVRPSFSCSRRGVHFFVVMFFNYFNIRKIFCSSFSKLHHQNSTQSEVRRNNTTCFLFFCQSR